MKLKHTIKRKQMKKALRNNIGRIATVSAALAGVIMGFAGGARRTS